MLLLLASASAIAQTPGEKIAFETISVRPTTQSPAGIGANGRMRRDPGRFTCAGCPLSRLLPLAYGVPNERIVGPSWLSTQRFDIQAVIPAGSTSGQLKLMLQDLLVNRFSIAAHSTMKVEAVYRLRVWKTIPALRAAAESGPAKVKDQPAQEIAAGKDGYPELQKVRSNASAMIDGRFRIRMVDASMSDFAAELQSQVDRPVVDTTGLKGKYDLELSWAAAEGSAATIVSTGRPNASEPDDSGPTIFSALQSQLGLKLEKAMEPVETLVIDRIARVPTEN